MKDGDSLGKTTSDTTRSTLVSAHGSLMSTESLPESRELTDTKSGDYDGQSALHSGITVRSIGLSH